jgi:hypothetical protein
MASDKTRSIALRHARDHLSGQAYAALTYEDLLTADEVCEVVRDLTPRRLARMRDDGKVVAIRVGNGHLYPRYQIDVARRALNIRTTATTFSFSAESLPWAAIEYKLGPGGTDDRSRRNSLKVMSHD